MSFNRLLVIDPSLVDRKGHHYVTSVRIAAAARKRFGSVLSFGNVGLATGAGADGIEPLFSDAIYNSHPPEATVLTHSGASTPSRRPAAELATLLRDRRIDERDVLFFHTATPDYAGLVVDGLTALAPSRRPRVALLFRYDPDRDAWAGSLDRLRDRLEAAGDVSNRLLLFGETGDIAAVYAERLGRRVSTLHHFSIFEGPRPARPRTGPATVGYFGEARTEKGFDAFVDAVERIGATPAASTLRFVAQVYASDDNSAQVAEAKSRLERLTGRIDITLHGVLDDADYSRLLGETDVVVVPHRLPNYRRRGSSIFLDALTCGSVAVVRADTWMSRLTAPGAKITFSHDDELAPKILEAAAVARDRPRVDDASMAETLRRFTPDACVAALLAACRDPEDGSETVAPDDPTALIITREERASAASAAQKAMLASAGFSVSTALFRPPAPGGGADGHGHGEAAPAPDWICETRPDLLARMSDLALAVAGDDGSWLESAMSSTVADLPPALIEFCAETPPELIICHGLDLLPVAWRLGRGSSKVVAQVDALRSLEKKVPLSEADHRAELASGRMADGLVFSSKETARAFERSGLGAPSLTAVGDPPPLEGGAFAASEGAARRLDRMELVRTTQGLMRRLIASGTNPVGAARVGAALRRRVAGEEAILCEAGQHPAEIDAVGSFIDHVFAPFLAERGYVLLVTGPGAEKASRDRTGCKGVTPVGALQHQAPLLEAPTVVVALSGADPANSIISHARARGLPVVVAQVASGAIVEPGSVAAAIEAQAAEARSASGSLRSPFARYCDSWALFLTSILGRKIVVPEKPQGAADQDDVAVDDAVARKLASPDRPLTPIPAGRHDISPETMSRVISGTFGFDNRSGETHWLWAASWYFGLLLDAGARGRRLDLALARVELDPTEPAINAQIFVDGAPHSVEITTATTSISVPLPSDPDRAGEPVLIEFFTPELAWRLETKQKRETRALSICIVGVDTTLNLVSSARPFAATNLT